MCLHRTSALIVLVLLAFVTAAHAQFPTVTPTPSATPSCASLGGATLSTTDTSYNAAQATNSNTTTPNSGSVTYNFACQIAGGCDGNSSPNNWSADLWGILNEHCCGFGTGTGSIDLSYPADGSGFSESVNMTGINGTTGVNGYPNIQLGSAGGGPITAGQPPDVFPVSPSALNQFVVTHDYAITVTTGGDNDVLIDDWLQPNNVYGSSIPDQQEEIEIFLYYNFAVPFGCVAHGTNCYVGQFVQPAIVNGTLENITWAEYNLTTAYDGGGSPQMGTVAFVPADVPSLCTNGDGATHMPCASTAYGAASATVVMDLLPFVNESWAQCQASTNCASTFTSSTPFFEGENFGSEFGWQANPNFTLTQSQYQVSACMKQNATTITPINSWQGSAASGTTCVVNTSGGPQQQVGDVEFGSISGQSSGSTLSCPSGWSSVISKFGTSSQAYTLVCDKVVASGDIGASPSFGSSSSDELGCGVMDLRGVDTSAPVDVAGTGSTGTTSPVSAASISPAHSGDTLLWFANSYRSALALPPNFVGGYDSAWIASGQKDTDAVGFFQPGISSGATGTVSAPSGGAFAWAGVQVAVKAASPLNGIGGSNNARGVGMW